MQDDSTKSPKATFSAWWDFGANPFEPEWVPLFNIPIFNSPFMSTVTEETVKNNGFEVPEYPTLEVWLETHN